MTDDFGLRSWPHNKSQVPPPNVDKLKKEHLGPHIGECKCRHAGRCQAKEGEPHSFVWGARGVAGPCFITDYAFPTRDSSMNEEEKKAEVARRAEAIRAKKRALMRRPEA